MWMLADSYDVVIGVDTHRDRHALAAVRSFDGAVLGSCSISADPVGYHAALCFAAEHASERRVWALEGTGSYGAGLARTLAAQDELVIEVDRPNRASKRANAKSDELDAIRAARTALGRETHATPRGGPTHDALRALMTTRDAAVHARTAALNQLRALVATAPDTLRERLRGHTTTPALLRRVRGLRATSKTTVDQHAVILTIRLTASRVEALIREADTLEQAISALVTQTAPQLLAESGIGPISAAQLLISWSHPNRIHSEAAFAQLAGAAPIPASSGQTRRHRLNRGGDRQLNHALHTILISRLKYDARTRSYLARATHQGKTRRDTIRSLKRYLARHLYRLLEHPQPPTPNTHDQPQLPT
jgi:transposase